MINPADAADVEPPPMCYSCISLNRDKALDEENVSSLDPLNSFRLYGQIARFHMRIPGGFHAKDFMAF